LETKPLNISNVGYGVSQGLPVIVEAFVREPGTLFAIQQPEVHLHPRAQAAIGEMIFSLAHREKKRFIVETHSDFTIDRYRVSLRESKDADVGSQILFFARVNGKNVVSQILIGKDGGLPDSQPNSYRSFFLKEGLKVIGF
jgi:predicted ATPase